MRKTAILLMLTFVLLVLAGCAGEKKDSSVQKQSQSQSITIGLMPDVDSIPFIIAQEKGFFKEEGITVNLKSFKSAMDRDSALQSGNLDGAISDMLAEAFAKAGGFDLVITSITNGNYKLVVNKSETATSIKDLKGKDVAISKNTIIDYVTDRIATEGGIATTDINRVVIPQIPTRLEMLQNNKIAAATMPDPLASVAVKNGGRVINTSEQLGINPGVMVFTTKAVNEKEKEIQAIYRAYAKAVDYMSKEPVENYIDMVIEKAGFPKDVKDALVLPKYQKAAAPQQKDIDAVIAWMVERKLIQQNYQYTDLVDTRFLR
jgi:NitT/TauT family transport system substrate-binding protein